jgi:hypothetical protein
MARTWRALQARARQALEAEVTTSNQIGVAMLAPEPIAIDRVLARTRSPDQMARACVQRAMRRTRLMTGCHFARRRPHAEQQAPMAALDFCWGERPPRRHGVRARRRSASAEGVLREGARR